MTQYYYFAPCLPPLALGAAPEISFEDFFYGCKINLNNADQKKIWRLRLYFDLINIRWYLLGQGFDERGQLSEKELEEALLVKEGLPAYVFDFLDRYIEAEDRIKNHGALMSEFFSVEAGHSDGFLQRYFLFEREYRLVLNALKAKKYQKNISEVLRFEDAHDPFVKQLLVQKDSETLEVPYDYTDLKEIFEAYADEPHRLSKAVDEYRFNKIDELIQGTQFSIDAILSYMIKLEIVHRRAGLDAKIGQQKIDQWLEL